MTDDIAQLARRLDELERAQAQLQAERDQYRALYQQMLERCRKLELGLRSHPAERLPEGDQLSLGVLGLRVRDDAHLHEIAAERAAHLEHRHGSYWHIGLGIGAVLDVAALVWFATSFEGTGSFGP